jgi:hypothetical protein
VFRINLKKLLPAPKQSNRFVSRRIFMDGKFQAKAFPSGKLGLLLLKKNGGQK